MERYFQCVWVNGTLGLLQFRGGGFSFHEPQHQQKTYLNQCEHHRENASSEPYRRLPLFRRKHLERTMHEIDQVENEEHSDEG